MFQGGDFQYPPLKGILPPEEFKKWEVSLLPTRSASDTPVSGSGGWTIGSFSDDPKKVEMCMEFTKDVFIGGMNEVTGQLPTSPKLFDTIDTFDEPIYDDFRVMLEHGKARPGRPRLSDDIRGAPDRHRHGPHRRGDAGGGPRQGVQGFTRGLPGAEEVAVAISKR